MKETETSKNILLQAIHLFASNGFTNTSLDDICRSASVCKPSIFHYFKSKDGLYKAAFRKACHNVASADIWGSGGNPERMLRETLCKLTRHYFSESELAGSLHLMFMEYVHPRLNEEEREIKDISVIGSRISTLFKAFCPDLSEADIKLLLCAILGELITSRSDLDKNVGPKAKPSVQTIVENLFRIASSVRRGLAQGACQFSDAR